MKPGGARRDWHGILGVPRGADAAAIKRAYRRLALLHHPDRNPGSAASAAKFMLVQEAYENLSAAPPPSRRV